MILDELIGIRAFPSVVQAAEIRELRDVPTFPPTLDFVRGYLGFDDRSRHALEAIVRHSEAWLFIAQIKLMLRRLKS